MGRRDGAEYWLADYFNSGTAVGAIRSSHAGLLASLPPDPDNLPPSRWGSLVVSRQVDDGPSPDRRHRRVLALSVVHAALRRLPPAEVAILHAYYAADAGWPGEARDDAKWRRVVPHAVAAKLRELARVALATDALTAAWEKPGHKATSLPHLLEVLCARGGEVLDAVEREAAALHRAALVAFAGASGLPIERNETRARRSAKAERLWTAVSTSSLHVVGPGVRS